MLLTALEHEVLADMVLAKTSVCQQQKVVFKAIAIMIKGSVGTLHAEIGRLSWEFPVVISERKECEFWGGLKSKLSVEFCVYFELLPAEFSPWGPLVWMP